MHADIVVTKILKKIEGNVQIWAEFRNLFDNTNRNLDELRGDMERMVLGRPGEPEPEPPQAPLDTTESRLAVEEMQDMVRVE